MTQLIAFRKHGNISIAGLDVAMPKHPLETGGRQQAVRSGIGGAGARQGDRSDRQARATFCTASLDDKTTVLGAHTGTETVCTLALQIAGLECSFHGANRFPKKVKGPHSGPNKAAQVNGFTLPLSTIRQRFYLTKGCG